MTLQNKDPSLIIFALREVHWHEIAPTCNAVAPNACFLLPHIWSWLGCRDPEAGSTDYLHRKEGLRIDPDKTIWKSCVPVVEWRSYFRHFHYELRSMFPQHTIRTLTAYCIFSKPKSLPKPTPSLTLFFIIITFSIKCFTLFYYYYYVQH